MVFKGVKGGLGCVMCELVGLWLVWFTSSTPAS